MATTKQIPRDEWQSYFERFTRQHLEGDVPESATIEVVSPVLGDQYESSGERLLGISYDRRSQVLDVLLDVEHLAFSPAEIWVIEDDTGFLSTIEVVRTDGTKEIIHISRSGPLERGAGVPAAPPP